MLRKIFKHARRGTLLKAIAGRILGHRGADGSAADAYYGDKAVHYSEKRLNEKKWHVEQSIVGDLLKDAPEGISVLDVPFGTGRFVEMYLKKAMSVHGLDISKDMLEASKQTLGSAYEKCDLHVGSADALPFEDGQFDLVVCCRFLGLIPFRMATNVLSELHRVTRSRVILYMNVRKSGFDRVHLIERIMALFGRNPKYFRVLSGNIDEDMFVDVLKSTGFTIMNRRIIQDNPGNTYVFYVLNKQQAPL